MSYNQETAMKPLTGEPFDACILNEREQRHGISWAEVNNHLMPNHEYCELRDSYIKLIEENPVTDQGVILAIGMIQNTICNGNLNPTAIKAFNLAITALKQMKQQETCNVCKSYERLLYTKHFKDGTVWVGALHAECCPKCGRKL